MCAAASAKENGGGGDRKPGHTEYDDVVEEESLVEELDDSEVTVALTGLCTVSQSHWSHIGAHPWSQGQ